MNKDLQLEQRTSKLDSVDKITESLIKARAVLNLIQGSGKDIKDGFDADHQEIMTSLWCVEDLLSEAETGLGSL